MKVADETKDEWKKRQRECLVPLIMYQINQNYIDIPEYICTLFKFFVIIKKIILI